MINNQKISLYKTDSIISQEKTSTSLHHAKTILIGEHSVSLRLLCCSNSNHNFYVKIKATYYFKKIVVIG